MAPDMSATVLYDKTLASLLGAFAAQPLLAALATLGSVVAAGVYGLPALVLPLRILAAFSLPVRANPLNLRRERHGIQQLARELAQTRSRAIELRVIQYGATRATLQDALAEAPGWDLIQLSGHGGRGSLQVCRQRLHRACRDPRRARLPNTVRCAL